LEAWTRKGRLYKNLESKLFISATFHAPEFRRAFAVAFPDVYGHGGTVTRRELVDLTGEVEQYHTFFVSMYTPIEKWNDLNQQDSIWRVTLQSSNEVSVSPKEIIPVTIDANLRAVYKHIDQFDEAYLMRFPLADPMQQVVINPQTSWYSLRIASALGVAELKWDLVARGAPVKAAPAPNADDSSEAPAKE